MKGYIRDIEDLTVQNTEFRGVLCTIYSPPNHRDGVVHRTRKDAEADDEHFDGRTSEPDQSA